MNNSALECVQMEEDEPEIILCGSAVYNYLGIAESQLDKCENPPILTVLSSLLERAIIRNDKAAAIDNNNSTNHSICRKKLSIFHGLRAPSIGIHSYIMRIFKYAKCSPSCFVLAYAYIIKLTASHGPGSSMISSLNVHRLLITSVMVATKFIDDRHYNNAYYAKIGGVSTVEMNGLELALLGGLGYRLHISMSAFESFCADFGKEAAMQAVLLGRPDQRPLIAAANCSFDEEQSRKVALLCTNYGGV